MELSKMTDNELKTLNKMILIEFKRRETVKGASFHIGQQVQWMSSKQGRMLKGTILKCNQKSATIQQEDAKTKWNVSWSLITAIAPEALSTKTG